MLPGSPAARAVAPPPRTTLRSPRQRRPWRRRGAGGRPRAGSACARRWAPTARACGSSARRAPSHQGPTGQPQRRRHAPRPPLPERPARSRRRTRAARRRRRLVARSAIQIEHEERRRRCRAARVRSAGRPRRTQDHDVTGHPAAAACWWRPARRGHQLATRTPAAGAQCDQAGRCHHGEDGRAEQRLPVAVADEAGRLAATAEEERKLADLREREPAAAATRSGVRVEGERQPPRCP